MGIAYGEPWGTQHIISQLSQTPAQRAAVEQQTANMLALAPAGRQQIVANGMASDQHVAAEAMYEDFQTDLRPEIATIKTAALVLYAFDPTITFPNGTKPTQATSDSITAAAYRGMPEIRLVRVDNSRHFIMFDQPLKLSEQIEAFID